MAERKFPDWATGSALLANGDPDKTDPGATKQGLGWVIEKPLVQTMNWLQNLFGHFLRANNEVKEVNTGYEAEAGETVSANNTAATCTIDLPTSPIDGQWVVIGGQGLFSLFSVIVDGGTNDIMVAADKTCTLDQDNIKYKFVWRNADSLWEIKQHEVDGRV